MTIRTTAPKPFRRSHSKKPPLAKSVFPSYRIIMDARTNRQFGKRVQFYLRHHWLGALRWREKLVLKEESFHLLMAGVIGVIGGAVNVFFFFAGEMVQRIFLPQPVDPV